MSININNLVNKPIDTTHLVHGQAKIRSVLDKVLNKKATTVVIIGSHDKMPGGYADFKQTKKPKTRQKKGARRKYRHRRHELSEIL